MGAKFTAKAQRALREAHRASREMGHTYIGTEHILLGLLADSSSIAAEILLSSGVTKEGVIGAVLRASGRGSLSDVTPDDMTPRTKKVIEDASREALSGDGYIGTEHLLYALLSEKDGAGYKIITSLGASVSAMKAETATYIEPERCRRDKMRWEIKGAPALSKYSKDLVAAAARGECDPVIGRERECERVMQILSRRTKNNPCLIGEPGVGKTAIVEGLAAKIADGAVPEDLKGKTIRALDIPLMIAGAKYRGEFEERMKSVMEEATRNPSVILFVDEIHTITGAGAAEGALDAANILKPALSRGDIRLIGATTVDEYRRHIEKDAALERRFQPVTVREPTPAESVAILRGLRDKYEAHHKMKISDGAIGAAVDLSVRYVKDRFLPDKAIDLIDESAARVRLERGATPPEIERIEKLIRDAGAEKKEAVLSEDFESARAVRETERALCREYKIKSANAERQRRETFALSAEDIAKTLTIRTGIPLSSITEREERNLAGLEKELLKSVIGQEEAVSRVCRAVSRGRLGIKDPDRPCAVLLFTGQSGVGKTELATALARTLFGSSKSLIRLDMSEYTEAHSVSKIVGSPPGYVGYEETSRLVDRVRTSPYSVVLFDEIEKAHRDVRSVLLQIMEDGRLTDSLGRECDFRNTIIIMTSNVGGEMTGGSVCLGFSANAENGHDEKRRAKEVDGALKAAFSPEFIGRIDDVVTFRPLGVKELSVIAEKFLSESASRLNAQGIKITFDKSIKEALVSRVDSKRYGARPLRRLVVSLVDDAIAQSMLRGEISCGDRAVCSFDGTNVRFEMPAETVKI